MSKDWHQGEIAKVIAESLVKEGVIDGSQDVVVKVTHGLSTTIRIKFRDDDAR